MFHDRDSFSECSAHRDARSIGAILAALPNIAALRMDQGGRSVKNVKNRRLAAPRATLALRDNLA